MKLTFELVDRVKQIAFPNVGWHHANHWGPKWRTKGKVRIFAFWQNWDIRLLLLSDLDMGYNLYHCLHLVPSQFLTKNHYLSNHLFYLSYYYMLQRFLRILCVMVHICIYVYVAIHVSKEKLLGFHQFLQRIFIMKKFKHTNIERTVL